jgi:hypothetical protein
MNITLSPKVWAIIIIAVLLTTAYLFVFVFLGGPENLDSFFSEPFGGNDYTKDDQTYVYV